MKHGFKLKGSKTGALLIHGFNGSTGDFFYIKDILHKELGFTVHAPLLRGHGTTYKDMEKHTWKEWVEDVLNAYEELSKECDEIHVVGYSMGALLALILAAQKDVSKLVLIAPGLFPRDKRAILAPVVQYFMPYKFKKSFKEEFPDEADKYDLDHHFAYDRYPMKKVVDLLRIERLTRKLMKKVSSPVLILMSHNDDLVEPKSAQYIYDHIGSKDKNLVWLKESRHICTLGPEKEIIHKNIKEMFL